MEELVAKGLEFTTSLTVYR